MEKKSLAVFSNLPEERLGEILDAVQAKREEIVQEETPKEYVQQKPIGGGGNAKYVPASYMDNKFKEHFPLYETKFAFPPFVMQNWIIVGVELKDKLTGNTEIGLKAHRIQVSAEKRKRITGYREQDGTWVAPTLSMADLTPFDMIDVGNDASACLTEAIKNAQSRFGIAADVYNKVIVSSEELQEMEKTFLSILNQVDSPMIKKKLQLEWSGLKPKDKLFYLEQLKEDYSVA